VLNPTELIYKHKNFNIEKTIFTRISMPFFWGTKG